MIKLAIVNRAVEGERILVDSICGLDCLKKLYFDHIALDFKYPSSFLQFRSNLKSLSLVNVNIEGDAVGCLSGFVNLSYLKLCNIFHNTVLGSFFGLLFLCQRLEPLDHLGSVILAF